MRRLLLLASAIVFVDTMFFAAVVPILPALSDEFGLSKSEAGVLTGAYAAGTFVGAIPGGWLAGRIGVRQTVVAGLTLEAAGSLAFAVGQEAWILDAARFWQGVGGAATWAGALAWLVAVAPDDRRGEMIGTAMGAAIGGALFGPAIGAAAEAIGRASVFSFAAAALAAMGAWAARTPAVPVERSEGLRALGPAIRDSRVAIGFWLMVLGGLIFGVLDVLVPLRLDELGAAAAAIAAVFLLAALLEALVSPVSGRFSDRLGRIAPTVVGLALTAALMAALALPDAAWLLGLLVVALGPAVGVLWAPAMAMISEGAERRGLNQGLAFALTTLAWSVGQLAGAAGGGRVGEALGDAAAYLSVSAACLVTFVLLALMVDREAVRAATPVPLPKRQ